MDMLVVKGDMLTSCLQSMTSLLPYVSMELGPGPLLHWVLESKLIDILVGPGPLPL